MRCFVWTLRTAACFDHSDGAGLLQLVFDLEIYLAVIGYGVIILRPFMGFGWFSTRQ
jgi:hypothetical protein